MPYCAAIGTLEDEMILSLPRLWVAQQRYMTAIWRRAGMGQQSIERSVWPTVPRQYRQAEAGASRCAPVPDIPSDKVPIIACSDVAPRPVPENDNSASLIAIISQTWTKIRCVRLCSRAGVKAATCHERPREEGRNWITICKNGIWPCMSAHNDNGSDCRGCSLER